MLVSPGLPLSLEAAVTWAIEAARNPQRNPANPAVSETLRTAARLSWQFLETRRTYLLLRQNQPGLSRDAAPAGGSDMEQFILRNWFA